MSDEPTLLNLTLTHLEFGQTAILKFTAQGLKVKIVTTPKHEPEVVQANFYQGINQHSPPLFYDHATGKMRVRR